jgi:hypothetical protein
MLWDLQLILGVELFHIILDVNEIVQFNIVVGLKFSKVMTAFEIREGLKKQ